MPSIWAMLTEQTCGEACWQAREDICRCSCGGKNHGCLRSTDGQRPERTAKIDGHRYTLAAVSIDRSLYGEAEKINESGGPYRTEKVTASSYNEETKQFEPSEIIYRHWWKDTDRGAPARVKPASKDQVSRWPELSAWRDRPAFEQYREPVILLWVRSDIG